MLANHRSSAASPSSQLAISLLCLTFAACLVGCANESNESRPQISHDETAEYFDETQLLSAEAIQSAAASSEYAAETSVSEAYANELETQASVVAEGPYTADLDLGVTTASPYPSPKGLASSSSVSANTLGEAASVDKLFETIPRTKFTLPSNPKYLTSRSSASSAGGLQYAPYASKPLSAEMGGSGETNRENTAAVSPPEAAASASIPPSFQLESFESTAQPRRFGSAGHLPDLADGAHAAEELEEDNLVAKASAGTNTVGIEAAGASSSKSAEYDTVRVYFATDREATADLLPGPLRLFGPAALACIAFCGLAIGLILARRLRFVWLTAAVAAAAMCAFIGQATLVRWQQLDRLATDASAAFTTSRFEVGDGKYPLHVGQAQLTIPPTHQKGKVESASILKLEFVETPGKHIVLQSVRIEEHDTWFESIGEDVAAEDDSQSPPLSSGRGAFVFVHGYNVRFDAALKRTAQLATDLGIQGPAICFSWPSQGQIAGYTADESTVNWSAPHFEQLILDLRDKAKVKSINIVAHSMGNRALLQAVERIGMRMEAFNQAVNQFAATEQIEKPKIIDQLIMAAPDVDARTFSGRYTRYLDLIAEHSTMYFSADDRALWLSELLHGGSRVGLSGTLASLDGIDAVDIGSQKLLSVGHSYYGSDPAVIDDLAAVLLKHQRPDARGWLKPEQTDAGAYWKLDRVRHAQLSSELVR